MQLPVVPSLKYRRAKARILAYKAQGRAPLMRDLAYTDERWVLEIREELNRRQGGLAELVHLITTSRPFQYKKSRQR